MRASLRTRPPACRQASEGFLTRRYPGQSHPLLVHTAVPGTESHEKLRLLSGTGPQALR
ncbi:hypothetical protein ACNYS0_01530 [Streptomyces sp. BH034]|uniref:hypothetical protein n=1 Tax=Streptomyces sp. BH034 TaxID=3402626 RepID=UPI003BB5F3D9